MQEIIFKVVLIMGVLLLFALPGFLLRKTNLVKTEHLTALSNILLYVAQPLLIIKAFAINPMQPSGKVLLNFLYVFLFSLAALLLTLLLSKLVFWKKPNEQGKRNVLTFIGTFSNCAFVGIPFIDMFTNGNSEAMMYLTVFNVAFNLLLWTVGTYLVTGDKGQISVKKALLNPCTIGMLVGFLLFLVPQINVFNMPAIKEVQQLVTYTGNMTAPLSMIIVGVRVAELSPKALFCDKYVYLSSLTRLVLSSALTFLLVLPFRLAGLFADSPYVLLAPVIAMSMPPAATVVAFAEKFGGERELAAAAYATGTLFSIITLPIILTLISL